MNKIQSINANPVRFYNLNTSKNASLPINNNRPTSNFQFSNIPFSSAATVSLNTTLNKDEINKYSAVLDLLKDEKPTETSFNLTPLQQMDKLLKSGKLLSKANDGSSMLDNLYEIATEKRAEDLNQKNLIKNILDNTLNPRIITQTLGDIPKEEVDNILKQLPDNDSLKKNPEMMSVVTSGTCPAASNEVNLADKNPAEYSRWVNSLSSDKKSVTLNVDLKSICSNKLDACMILNMLGANVKKFGFDKTKVEIKLDPNAFIRAKLQDNHWDLGERNVADVLVQSAIMQAGSQNTYNSLTDMRAGDFSTNPKGLIEVEKTFVESLIKNQEITSLVYQIIDENQNLVGHTCSFDKMEKHIKDSIDSGNNVIIGYVLTNETVGKVASGLYNPMTDGPKNRVINGHEITIVDYKTDKNGKTTFVCIDTDDDSPEYVEYSADWLLPKIHHAGYPAKIVENDEKEIMKKANML